MAPSHNPQACRFSGAKSKPEISPRKRVLIVKPTQLRGLGVDFRLPPEMEQHFLRVIHGEGLTETISKPPFLSLIFAETGPERNRRAKDKSQLPRSISLLVSLITSLPVDLIWRQR